MRRSICVLLAAIAVLTSCSTYLQSGLASVFRDGIYYKASDESPKVDTLVVSTSLISDNNSGSNVNVYVNPVGLSFGFAFGYPWISNWYWDRWCRPWDPWWRPWHPWHPWDPWWRPWHPWGPGPIYIRDPFTIRTGRDIRASGGGFTYRSSGSAGYRYTNGFSGGASSSGGTYGRSVSGAGSRPAVQSTPRTTGVNTQRPSGQSYGRDVRGAGNAPSRSYNTRSSMPSGTPSSGSFGGGGMSRPSGGFSGGMSSRGGGAGFRR